MNSPDVFPAFDAPLEERLERMYQAAGTFQYGRKPVLGATLDALDRRRLREYQIRVLDGPAPDEEDRNDWERRLLDLDMMSTTYGPAVPTVNAVLLFGRWPSQHVPQAGVRAICHSGARADSETRADEHLCGPMTPLGATDGSVIESGLVEQALDFARRNTQPSPYLDGAQRVDRWEYPLDVVQEMIVNALVHRDYTITEGNITLTIYSDRLEVRSPGSLARTMNVQKMLAGARYRQNQTLFHVMRDYQYMDARGMGVRTKIVPGMRQHNDTEPELVEEHDAFTVRLWKSPKTA